MFITVVQPVNYFHYAVLKDPTWIQHRSSVKKNY